MILLIDGDKKVELTKEDMDTLFSAAEDYNETYPKLSSGITLIQKLLKVYRMPGSDSLKN